MHFKNYNVINAHIVMILIPLWYDVFWLEEGFLCVSQQLLTQKNNVMLII